MGMRRNSYPSEMARVEVARDSSKKQGGDRAATELHPGRSHSSDDLVQTAESSDPGVLGATPSKIRQAGQELPGKSWLYSFSAGCSRSNRNCATPGESPC